MKVGPRMPQRLLLGVPLKVWFLCVHMFFVAIDLACEQANKKQRA